MFKLLALALCAIALEVSGHGMMMDPINRSSLWRVDPSAPANYNDMENFCGGIGILWQNNGNCGVCGDIYTDPHPQKNENTGTYGGGKVVKTYKAGEVITTEVRLTANHLGHFEFSLCELKNPNAPESGEDCFQLLQFEDGSTKFPITGATPREVLNRVQLPAGFTCERCVLRWHYRTGNNWGTCEDGQVRPGCGNQEYFRSCSDIAIV